MTLQEITEALDSLIAKGQKRRDESLDPCIRGLHTAECEWLTKEELQELGRLQLLYVKLEPTIQKIRERVRVKRAARVLAAQLEKE